MKKIFYILASAIVALGAVACENEALDNVNPDNNVKGEGLTITATIDEATKVAFEGLTPSWEEGDKLVIGEYEFTFTEGNKFTCEKEGVFSLCDGQKKEITAGTFDSSNGINGSAWWAQSVIEREGTEVTLELTTALLKVTAAADNTVLKSVLFSNEEVALTKGVETYVPIWQGDNYTVTYFVDGIECKSLTKNFEAGKIYKLGTLVAPNVFIVENNASWAKVNLYAWSGDTKICGEWPGTTMTQIGSTNRYYVEIPAEYVGQSFNYIVNNGDNQTRDLEVDNFEACYTKAIGDPDPNNITIYLNNNWSVSDLKMHTWDPTLWEGQTWENRKAPDGTVTTDWGTFSYWNVDANQIKSDNVGNLLITGTDKQTADLYDVNYSKDVYLQFVWKNEKDSLEILTTPY